MTETTRKLGKQPAKRDPRTLELANYIDKAKFAGMQLPTSVFDTPQISEWPMYRNDSLGDCVEAAMAHTLQLVSKMGSGAEQRVSDADVVKVYSDVAGYNPSDPSTDQGTVMLDALNYWRKTGIAGHRIVGFAQFNPLSFAEWKAALALFGVAYVGLALPYAAQDDSEPDRKWHVERTAGVNEQPGSWGGHCVPFFDYGRYEVDCITWGYRQRATWQFVATFCDEAYVVFDQSWVSAVSGRDPHGLDSQRLLDALAQFS